MVSTTFSFLFSVRMNVLRTRTLWALLFLMLFHIPAFASIGDAKTDSIKADMYHLSGSQKVDALVKLSRAYMEIDLDSMAKYASLASRLSNELEYQAGLANSLLMLGTANHYLDKVTEARNYYNQSLKLFEALGDKKGQANAHNSLGNSYMEQGDYKTAQKYHAGALLLRVQIDDKQGLANSYNNIGNAYAGEASYYLALNNHLKGLAIKEELNDTSKSGLNKMAMSYFNIGRLYLAIEDLKRAEEFFNKAEELYGYVENQGGLALIYAARGGVAKTWHDFETAIGFYSKAIEILKQSGKTGELADNYTRIAFAYYGLALKADSLGQKGKQNKNYDIAFNYANQALNLSEQLDYEQGIVSSYILMGNINREWGDYKNSEICFNKAAGYRLLTSNKIVLYKGLYLLKLKQKNYKAALENYTNYTALNDSVYNTQNTLKTTSLGQAYEEEKKEKERELTDKMREMAHDEEIKRQRVIQLFILIGLLVVAVFAFFVFRSYRQKQKANIIITKQKAEVESAYKIIEEQKKIVDQHNKDVTDSINYAKRIQTALLASDSLLKKNLPEYFVLYKPKDIVSGDFYWASELTDKNSKKFILCSGDCTGHGVPGAFMSLLNISKLNETVNEKKRTDPGHILNTVREEIIKALNPENATEVCNDGMDCTLCVMELFEKQGNMVGGAENVLRGTLSYAAANNPFYLIRDKQLIVGHSDKIPVGKSLKENEPFSSHTLELMQGDIIYLLTDGYADQFGGKNGKKFKYKTLEDLLLANHLSPLSEQKRLLDSTIEQWRGTNEQVDDILIIGIRIS